MPKRRGGFILKNIIITALIVFFISFIMIGFGNAKGQKNITIIHTGNLAGKIDPVYK